MYPYEPSFRRAHVMQSSEPHMTEVKLSPGDQVETKPKFPVVDTKFRSGSRSTIVS